MKQNNHYDFDVIVIGAGLGGLVTATRLSILGHKVGLFEQEGEVGGYNRTIKLGDNDIELSLSNIGGLDKDYPIYNVFKECNIINKISLIEKDNLYSIQYHDKIIDFPVELKEYLYQLEKVFPKSRRRLKLLFKVVKRIYHGYEKTFIKSNDFKNLISVDVWLYLYYSMRNLRSFLRIFINDEELLNVITSDYYKYGLPINQLSAASYFIPFYLKHVGGSYYIKGGSKQLNAAFLRSFLDHGGKLYLSNNIEQIIIKKDNVYGIRLKRDEIYTTRKIICNISPYQVYGQLIRADLLNSNVMRSLYNDQISSSMTRLYLVLDCLPQLLGINRSETILIRQISSEEDYNHVVNGHYHFCNLSIINYNMLDKNINHRVITISFLDYYRNWNIFKSEYLEKKKEVISDIMKRLEVNYPNIRRHVVASYLATPKTFERLTKNTNGAIYGFSDNINQSSLRRFGPLGKFKGLSFVGAWTQPGGSIESAIISGDIEAVRIDNILRKKRRKR